MNDFGDYEFAAGSLTGFRRFNIDAFGRLLAVSANHVWRPGENVAICNRDRKSHTPECMEQRREWVQAYSTTVVTFTLFGSTFACDCPMGEVPPALHDPNCTCGFYAYSDYTETENHGGTLEGIVRGYGKTVIGTKGFRCEKAEILALCVPQRFGNWRRWLRFTSTLALLTLASALLGLVQHRWVIFGVNAGCTCMNIANAVRWWLRRPGENRQLALIQRNYPDVKVFPSRRQMLEAYPLTASAAVSPETDPNFWTRP